MSNIVPTAFAPVVQLSTDALNGVETHGTAVGLKHITAAMLRTSLETLIGKPAGPNNVPPAVPGVKFLWTEAKANKTAKTGDLRSVCSNGRALAAACIGVLKPLFGARYNTAWEAAGITGNSLAAPANPMVMLQQFRAFFGKNPNREVPALEPYHVTAAACEAAADLIAAAQTASNQSNVDAATAQKNYETALQAMHDLLCDLRTELSQLLSDDDERWYAFGFERPGDPETPPVPENLTVAPGAPGSRMVIPHCDESRGADSYRFRAVNTVTKEKVTEVIVTETETVLKDLPLNTTLAITVSARNTTGGESPMCEPFTIAVP